MKNNALGLLTSSGINLDPAAIVQTYKRRGSCSALGSEAWYIEDLSRCLHPTLCSFSDAKKHTKGNGRKVHGVYLRKPELTNGEQVFRNDQEFKKRKIGTGYVENGGIMRDARTSNDTAVLETECFIPCRDAASAAALERALQYYFGGNYKVPQGIKVTVDRTHNLWIEPATNSDDQRGGNEWYDFSNFDNPVSEFVQAVASLTSAKNVDTTLPEFDYYQEDGSKLIAAHILARHKLIHGSLRDFFLLMKPRSGKNMTALLGIATFAKVWKELNPGDDCILVDVLSLWPSAFSGFINDVRNHRYADDIAMGYVDTSVDNWQQQYQEMKKTHDVVFRLASMQSLNKALSDEAKHQVSNDETDEDADNFDANKAEIFRAEPASLALLDETDHGMRTPLTKKALDGFNYLARVYMSGTDLYALKHDIREDPKNYFLYDIIDERRDILDNKLKRKRSLIQVYTFSVDDIPFADLTPRDMDLRGLSRRMINLMKTNASNTSDTVDAKTALYLHTDGTSVGFVNEAEVIAFIKKIYEYQNLDGLPCPGDISHLFWTMPSKSSCKAFYNLIVSKKLPFFQHHPLLANSYKNIRTIEIDVQNDQKNHGKTVFITVGKMLRGAKAYWNGVVRCDDRSDYKVGLQISLRAQNVDSEEYCHIWDCNPYRAVLINYDIIQSRSNGKNINSIGTELNKFIPLYRNSKGICKQMSWEDITDIYQESMVREGFRRDCNYDEEGILDSAQFLTEIAVLKNKNKNERLPEAGKTRKILEKKKAGIKITKQEKKEIEDLKAKAKSIGVQTGLLLMMNPTCPEIDKLLTSNDNNSDDILHSWFDHLGFRNRRSYWNQSRYFAVMKARILRLFDQQKLNEQLVKLQRRIEMDGYTSVDLSEFNRITEGDVNTPVEAVEDLYDKDGQFLDRLFEDHKAAGTLPKVFDPACAGGNHLVPVLERCQRFGFDPNEVIYFADQSRMNLLITSKRLGVDTSNSFVYNLKEINDAKVFANKTKLELGIMEFDLCTTNPPFGKNGQGNKDNNNWSKFFKIVNKLTKSGGYEVIVSPGSWGSLGAGGDDSDGSSTRRNQIDCNSVKYVDFSCGKYFDVASTFTSIVMQRTPWDKQSMTELEFSDGTIKHDLWNKFPCFPLNHSESIWLDILDRFKNAEHYEFYSEDPNLEEVIDKTTKEVKLVPAPRRSMLDKLANGSYAKSRSSTHPYRCYHTNGKDYKNLYSKFRGATHDEWKLIFATSGSMLSDHSLPIAKDISLSDHSFAILLSSVDSSYDEEEMKNAGKSIKSVYQSWPIQFLITKVFYWSGYYNGKFISWIPKLPHFNKDGTVKIYTDEEILKLLFNETERDILNKYKLQEEKNHDKKRKKSID